MAALELCALCGELSPDERCGDGHSLCATCVSACRRTTEKLVSPGVPVGCPISDCQAFVADVRPIEPPAEKRFARLVKLAETDADYQKTVTTFARTLRKQIIGVYRVENAALECIHQACRARMQREGRRLPNGREVGANGKLVFHGTTRAAAGSIVREGFDASRSGSVHGQALGAGVYTAEDALTASCYTTADLTGTNTMLLCSALLGDDSGRDSVSSLTVHVLKREQQILPLFLIQYRT